MAAGDPTFICQGEQQLGWFSCKLYQFLESWMLQTWGPEINSPCWRTGHGPDPAKVYLKYNELSLWTLWQVRPYLAWLQFCWLAPIFSSFGNFTIQSLIFSINCNFLNEKWEDPDSMANESVVNVYFFGADNYLHPFLLDDPLYSDSTESLWSPCCYAIWGMSGMELSSWLYLMRHTGTHYQHTLDTSHISFRNPGRGREASNKRIHEKIIKKNL